jgi:hypothetical protein
MEIAAIEQMALALPGVISAPHFDKIAFKTRKRIFLTLAPRSGTMSARLTAIEQDIFLTAFPGHCHAATGQWGRDGWTVFQCTQLDEETITDVVMRALERGNSK